MGVPSEGDFKFMAYCLLLGDKINQTFKGRAKRHSVGYCALGVAGLF